MNIDVGTKVWYCPDTCHKLDKDHQNKPVFAFEFVSTSPNAKMPYRQGEAVDFDHPNLGSGYIFASGTPGVYRTGAGHLIRPTKHLAAWPAIVREVFADGTVALDIAHPSGGSLVHGHAIFDKGCFVTLHYPAVGAKTGLRYSKTFEPHTWHLLEDKPEK